MTEFRFLRSIFYTLKRKFPRQITLINKSSHDINIVTGVITETTSTKVIRRAVVLHRNESSLIQKVFGHDAPVRMAERYVLLAQSDLNGFEISKATIVEYDDEYWSIVEDDNHSKQITVLFLNRITGDVGPSTPEPLDEGPFI